jgi:putative NIF3 family GTP cyclohydrolase 1 type 2
MESKIVATLISAHPYEEVAYDIYMLGNSSPKIGAGMTGELKSEMTEAEFLSHVKNVLKCDVLRHTKKLNKKIKRVAICGGSGSFLLKNAISSKADAYISADFKYHEFFDADGKILAVDTGHFENEQFTQEIFYDLLTEKFPKFAIRFTEIKTNPVNYL